MKSPLQTQSSISCGTDDKPTLTFLLHQLNIVSFQPEKPAEFYATLTNPRPVGEIQTHGQFGPWNGDEPSQAPVQGNYTFWRADLATFKGISGFLSSQGVFSGVLDYIQVHGKTQTPDFALTTSNHPVPLNTEFNAIVDGINGNTILNSVDAQLLNSSLLCKGEVAKMPGDAGRTIVLDVTAQNARIEDLLRLVVKSDKAVNDWKCEPEDKIRAAVTQRGQRGYYRPASLEWDDLAWGLFASRRTRFRRKSIP